MIKINHIAAYVKDLEKAKEFFIKYFDASSNEMYHNPKTGLKTYFLSFGNDVRLEIMTRPELSSHKPKGYQYGYTHLAFSLGNREAVDRLIEKSASIENQHYKSSELIFKANFYMKQPTH